MVCWKKNMVYWEKNVDVFFGLFVEKEVLLIVNDEELDFDGEIKVMKLGRIIGVIIGDLMDDSLIVRVDMFFLFRGYIVFFNCYVVENIIE